MTVIKKTGRGFKFVEFQDTHGTPCNIQKSSSAMEECIWIGADNLDPKELIPGQGWTKITSEYPMVGNNRIHLSREKVAELLPILHRFVDKGDL